MWTPTSRHHSRACLRYASDMSDAEWRLRESWLPRPRQQGRRRAWPQREIINALVCVLGARGTLRMVPQGFPPFFRWLARLRDDGVFESLNHHLVMHDRERTGRKASPSAAMIDSQSVKNTESRGPRGYDAGRKIKGRKRHAMVDTDGRGLVLHAHPASIQDRDGGPRLLRASRRRWAFVEPCFADSGHAGERVANASRIRVEIVRKPKGQVGFAVHARRWVVERFFPRINRNRRPRSPSRACGCDGVLVAGNIRDGL